MALSANTPRGYDPSVPPVFSDYPAAANSQIYEGSAVGLSSGYSRALTAGDVFQGFAEREADNNPGSAADITVKIRQQGVLKGVSVVGTTAVTNVNTTVYMSDDGTFTLTSTSNSSIGKIIRWYSGTTCDVFFQGAALRSI